MRERTLDPQKLDQLQSNLESGIKLLQSANPGWNRSDPAETIELLQEGIRAGTVFMLEAAALLADCLAKATDWKLVSLEGKSFTGLALVSPDGAYAIYPELVAAKAARNPEEGSLKAHFDTIKCGSLPPSEPGTYTQLG